MKSTKIETITAVPPGDTTRAKTVPGDDKAEPVTVRVKTEVAPPAAPCVRTLTANVTAMSQPIMLNRLGATIPDGLMFVLTSDTVANSNPVQLREGKRPRPLVLRANVGDCLTINLTNAIPAANFSTTTQPNAKTGTTEVSLHVQGMEWVQGTQDDGSFVGLNNSSLASAAPVPANMPPQTQTYNLFAREEGTFLLYTTGDTASLGDQLIRGLFGALNVQPAGAEWYRSQVTADELALATYNANNLGSNTLNCPNPANCVLTITGPPARQVKVKKAPSGQLYTLDNHPLIDYGAVDKNKIPILKMLDANNQIIYSDLTAIITGPNAGRFPGTTGPNNPEPPCNAENNPALNPNNAKIDPLFCTNPASPDRKQPYREITTIYHGALIPVVSQAFPVFTDPGIGGTVTAGDDAFAINYGTGGIGAEVYANRVGVGPMGDCVDCKFEEFFLSAWSVADPAMLVDSPANSGKLAPCNTTAAFESSLCGGTKNPNTFPYTMSAAVKAKAAFYPDDPSNVYHSYINDHLKFRILHGGRDVTHVHHQHAHQWLQSPNSDESSYLDSQMISPGASYTLEMTYNGSGNRNKVVGDSIFHCHFYPHFAAGMWAMWRTHDTFESGTFVYPKNTNINGKDVGSQAVPGSRALPDGEIIAGTPTPAIVPLPTLPMAPLPAYAQIQNNVKVNGAQITFGGQVVIGGVCSSNKINNLDVIGGCVDGTLLNGTVINSAFDGTTMTGQFQPSVNNVLENPGFPYFIPGIAGARPPHPPFDFAPDGLGGFLDGGLPRHVVAGGSISYESHDQFDWSKDVATMNAVQLPETGTDVEKAAFKFFGVRCHQTFLPDGTSSNCALPTPFGFIVNGLPNGPQPGAPFADPAVNDLGQPIGTKRVYKAAAIQLDVAFNKKRWHFPQERILTLWKDVQPTLNFSPVSQVPGARAPEPLFFRGNSGDVIEYWHTNLVPNYYLVDDFQVRTPTDILGQHIHLVKFDVTSSDGAGNGFNYEDGTFSPQEVQDNIEAINATGGITNNGVQQLLPAPKAPPTDILNCGANPNDPRCKVCPHNWTPTFRPQCPSWLGAQTTIQRWYIDPLVDNSGVDRTMRTVFTHDHFGPSTHQQVGLYAGLLIEPTGASWRNPEDGSAMGGPATSPPVRSDGGPTSWKVDILAKDKNNVDVSYREFMLEFQDLQLAYAWAAIPAASDPRREPDPNPKKGWIDPVYAINPPGGLTPKPDLVSTGTSFTTPGTQTVNYRHEPIAWRINPDANDMSYIYDSSLKQASSQNATPNGDPFTPLLRAYQNDNVQVRTLVGAHVFAHQFNLDGPIWFSEPSWKNSGYRSAQAMGLSEHFEMLFKVPSSSAPTINRACPDKLSTANCVDYLYSPSFDEFGIVNGMWGLFRSYSPKVKANQLVPLPNNAVGANVNVTYATCPAILPPPGVKRVYNVTAVTAQKALADVGGKIVVNSRSPGLELNTGIMYVRTEDLKPDGKLFTNVPVEPLILRANAGDCIEVNLTNALDPSSQVFKTQFNLPSPFNGFVGGKPLYASKMSRFVGLHPQLLGYDAARSTGLNIGWNSSGQPNQLADTGKTVKYQWYAGKIDRATNGSLSYTPVEFGSLNLFPSDQIYQNLNGLFGSMIIEPAGATWTCGDLSSVTPCESFGLSAPTTRAQAKITVGNTFFREYAVMISDDLLISRSNSSAVNYRSEPFLFRYPNITDPNNIPLLDYSCMQSNQLFSVNPPPPGDPQTPIFTADKGDKVRFRLTHPFGTGTSQVFTVNGHVWQRNPYTNDSMLLGSNSLSQWIGSFDNHGSSDHRDLLIDKAGGESGKEGDYLYSVFVPIQARQGPWGIFRVGNAPGNQINAACSKPPQVAPQQVVPRRDDLDRFIRKPVNRDPKP
ncbi:MAG TPA: hypothetical protein VKB46_04280 [Pyrinomonadaceae bacterium]|nr:hypothetical protein [Pyrinomonadaceae bacterium]